MSTQILSTKNGRGSWLWVGAVVGGIVAAITNLIVFVVATQLLSIEIQVFLQGPGSPLVPMPALPVILLSFVPALFAALLLFILRKFTTRSLTIFNIIGTFFLLFSFLPILSLPPEVGTSAKIVLTIMHLAAGGIIIGALNRTNR